MERDAIEPRRRRWPYLLGLVVVVAGAWWFFARRPPAFLLPEVDVVPVVAISPAEAQTVLTATGYTYARTRAAVGAKIIGRVVSLPVDEGDAVRRGQVIAVLDSEDLRAGERRSAAAVLEAQARLADAEREARRSERLVASGVAAQAEFDAAATRLAVAQAQVETALAALDSVRAQLAYTTIYSPIDGVVIERNVEVGEMVAPGGFTSQQSTGAIVRIADPTSLEVEADINESTISRLVPGQPAQIKIDAVPDRSYRGRLRQIVPTADRQRAVVEVKVTVEDRDQRLVPDMSCSVTFLEQELAETPSREQPPQLLVPSSAVSSEGANRFVLVLRGDRLQKRLVEVGEQTGDSLAILAGVAASDLVVRAPTEKLRDGLRVRQKAVG